MELTIAEIGEYLKKCEEKSPKDNSLDHFWNTLIYSSLNEEENAELIIKLNPLIPEGSFYRVLKLVISHYPKIFKKFKHYITYDIAVALLEYMKFYEYSVERPKIEKWLKKYVKIHKE